MILNPRIVVVASRSSFHMFHDYFHKYEAEKFSQETYRPIIQSRNVKRKSSCLRLSSKEKISIKTRLFKNSILSAAMKNGKEKESVHDLA